MTSIIPFLTFICALLLCAAPSVSLAAEAPQWDVTEGGEQSLTFTTTQMGAAFTGRFENFTPQITFHPDALDQSHVKVEISLQSAETGDEERDEALQNEDWFNTQQYPIATFETADFQMNEGDNQDRYPYLARGRLDLSGVQQDITLPFSFTIDDSTTPHSASAAGAVTLDRIEFGLGAENWDDHDSVGHKVEVRFQLDLTARTPESQSE